MDYKEILKAKMLNIMDERMEEYFALTQVERVTLINFICENLHSLVSDTLRVVIFYDKRKGESNLKFDKDRGIAYIYYYKEIENAFNLFIKDVLKIQMVTHGYYTFLKLSHDTLESIFSSAHGRLELREIGGTLLKDELYRRVKEIITIKAEGWRRVRKLFNEHFDAFLKGRMTFKSCDDKLMEVVEGEHGGIIVYNVPHTHNSIVWYLMNVLKLGTNSNFSTSSAYDYGRTTYEDVDVFPSKRQKLDLFDDMIRELYTQK